EVALDECMRAHGGFEHNRHGLRIAQLLEYRYSDFPGLNLSWEVLESQACHSKRPDAAEVKQFLGAGQPLLEAQGVDAADSLAYAAHDIDDALSGGLIAPADLQEVPMWQLALQRVLARKRPGPEQFQPTIIRALIDWQVSDLLEHTQQ